MQLQESILHDENTYFTYSFKYIFHFYEGKFPVCENLPGNKPVSDSGISIKNNYWDHFEPENLYNPLKSAT